MLVPDTAIRNRTTVFVLMFLIIVVGIYSYMSLPREAAPDVEIPNIKIDTIYEGVSPADMETTVTMPIEEELTGLNGVKEIRSFSTEGVSTIIVEFLPEIGSDEAKLDVKDKVDRAKAKPEFPRDAEDPTVTEINVAEFPIMMINVSGEVSLWRLKKIAEKLEDAIKANVPGVLDVTIYGGLEPVIYLEIDPDRVAEYQLTFAELAGLIDRESVNVSAGAMETEGMALNVRLQAEFNNPDTIEQEIRNLKLTVRDGKPIYLRDVADVRYTFRDRETYARLDGRPTVTVAVQKRIGANIVDIADAVKHIVAEAEKQAPAGVEFTITDDQSKDIRMMVADLENNIVTGLVLVVLVLVLFMGPRTSLIVAMAIPMSMLISFSIIQLLGYTLNMIVLFSLILALGMLVDNAIVIVENIYRFRTQGLGPVAAAMKGAGEVAWPVITSTATTLAAFGPMIFWSGTMGDFMKYLPITLIITLSSSLFVALVINPTICSVLGGGVKTKRDVRHPFVEGYRRTLGWAVHHRITTLTLAFCVLLGVCGLYALFGRGVEFFPEMEPRRAIVNIRMPQGTNIRGDKGTDGMTRRMELRFDPFVNSGELTHVVSNVGSSSTEAVMFGGSPGGPHQGNITLIFPDFESRLRSSSEAMKEMRFKLGAVAGADLKLEKQEDGPPTGAAVTVRIIGREFRELSKISDEVINTLRDARIPNMVNLRNDYEASRTERRLEIDRARAAQCGVSPNGVGLYLKALIYGMKVGTWRVFNDEYDIMIRAPLAWRENPDNLAKLKIPNGAGSAIPITTFSELKDRGGYGTITRIDRNRVVTVTADAEGRPGPEVLADVVKALKPTADSLKDRKGDTSYRIEYAGEAEEQEKAVAFLSKAFGIALLLIVLILVAQFNTFSAPLIIMTTVVLSLIGVLAGLMICRMPFGVIMTGIGVISLAGVVVNNAIVLLDCARQLQRRGMTVVEAVLEAGATRLRPVLLTAATTILGLVPMATGVAFDVHEFTFLADSESSQWWSSMAVAVIFGLTVATVLTLIVVPTLYAALYSLAARMGLGGLERAGAHVGEHKPEHEDF